MWFSVAGRYRSLMVAILATVFAALAALLHVYIFVMESVQWTQPKTWKRFGVADQAAAEITKPMAYNQGFYNLFLALGVVVGLVLMWSGLRLPGIVLTLFVCVSMVLAALVLVTSNRRMLRAALVQGAAPLVAVVCLVVALATA